MQSTKLAHTWPCLKQQLQEVGSLTYPHSLSLVSNQSKQLGGLCGATSLDQRFLCLMRDRLGSQAHLLDGIHGGRGSRLMQSFDSAKRNFGTNEFEDDEFLEHGLRALVADDDTGIDEEYITLS